MRIRPALLAAVLAAASVRSIAQVDIGAPAPDLLGKTYEGQDFLVSAHQGKVVVATFWASWCGPCQLELPLLEGMQKVIGPDRVKVVAISIESKDRFKQIGSAAKSLALTFVHDTTGSISRAYGVKGIPHLIVIGRDGKVQRRFVGYSEKQVENIIAQVHSALSE